jgi:tRNA-2-methylthio-N6-dimethylallyladenosine synthase
MSVLHVIAKHPIFANTFIYLFNQGNRNLKEMNRLHTREEYMTLIKSELLYLTDLFRKI